MDKGLTLTSMLNDIADFPLGRQGGFRLASEKTHRGTPVDSFTPSGAVEKREVMVPCAPWASMRRVF